MPPRHHHGGHHHHRGGHHGGPPIGALLVGGLVGGMVGASMGGPGPPRYRRGQRYHHVVIHTIPQGMPPLKVNEMLVSVICPIGARPGDPLEIEVDNHAYALVIPQVQEGQSFYARIIKRAPRPVTATVIASPAPAPQPQPVVYQASQQLPIPPQQQYQTPAAAAVSSSYAPQAHAQVVGVLPPTAAAAAAAPVTYSDENPFGDDDEDDSWVIEGPLKTEFDVFFTSSGPSLKNGKMVLSPAQVRDALLPTGLAKASLRTIWELSDIDKDGSLDADEFAVAMYLCRESQQGKQLPAQLPPNVVPPSKRNPF